MGITVKKSKILLADVLINLILDVLLVAFFNIVVDFTSVLKSGLDRKTHPGEAGVGYVRWSPITR
jgi:hypothetical protein